MPLLYYSPPTEQPTNRATHLYIHTRVLTWTQICIGRVQRAAKCPFSLSAVLFLYTLPHWAETNVLNYKYTNLIGKFGRALILHGRKGLPVPEWTTVTSATLVLPRAVLARMWWRWCGLVEGEKVFHFLSSRLRSQHWCFLELFFLKCLAGCTFTWGRWVQNEVFEYAKKKMKKKSQWNIHPKRHGAQE